MKKVQWIILIGLAVLMLLAIPWLGNFVKDKKCTDAGGTWNARQELCDIDA